MYVHARSFVFLVGGVAHTHSHTHTRPHPHLQTPTPTQQPPHRAHTDQDDNVDGKEEDAPSESAWRMPTETIEPSRLPMDPKTATTPHRRPRRWSGLWSLVCSSAPISSPPTAIDAMGWDGGQVREREVRAFDLIWRDMT